jgi:hypothetical protein
MAPGLNYKHIIILNYMKFLTTIITLIALFALSPAEVKCQDYADSTHYGEQSITVQLTQSSAYYLAEIVQERFSIENRFMADAVYPFLGSGNNPDSVFTVSVQAKYIVWILESMMVRHNVVYSADDYNKIVLGTPAISGFTPLATQIVNKANGATSQRFAARYIRDLYIRTTAAEDALKAEDRQRLRTLFKPIN